MREPLSYLAPEVVLQNGDEARRSVVGGWSVGVIVGHVLFACNLISCATDLYVAPSLLSTAGVWV